MHTGCIGFDESQQQIKEWNYVTSKGTTLEESVYRKEAEANLRGEVIGNQKRTAKKRWIWIEKPRKLWESLSIRGKRFVFKK